MSNGDSEPGAKPASDTDSTDDRVAGGGAGTLEEGAGTLEEDADEDPFAALDLFGADLSKIAAERDEYLDSLRRLQADFDNYRKRAMRQQTELLERASENVLVQLLPVLDVLDLAEAHSSRSSRLSPTQEGDADAAVLSQIGALLRETLAREGLERIDEVGVGFDPTIHDAVAHEQADEDVSPPKPSRNASGTRTASSGDRPETKGDPDGEGSDVAANGPRVVDVMRAGYRLKGRVVRPAMVKVKG